MTQERRSQMKKRSSLLLPAAVAPAVAANGASDALALWVALGLGLGAVRGVLAPGGVDGGLRARSAGGVVRWDLSCLGAGARVCGGVWLGLSASLVHRGPAVGGDWNGRADRLVARAGHLGCLGGDGGVCASVCLGDYRMEDQQGGSKGSIFLGLGVTHCTQLSSKSWGTRSRSSPACRR